MTQPGPPMKPAAKPFITAYATARIAGAIYERSILKAGTRVSWRAAVGRSDRRDAATAS